MLFKPLPTEDRLGSDKPLSDFKLSPSLVMEEVSFVCNVPTASAILLRLEEMLPIAPTLDNAFKPLASSVIFAPVPLPILLTAVAIASICFAVLLNF